MTDEGYIKFNLEHIRKNTVVPAITLQEINTCRNTLKSLGWIGVLDDGIGYGNISVREDDSGFWISASGTGALDSLGKDSVSLVTGWDIAKNYIRCEGVAPASSESMSHAAVYDAGFMVNAVIHIHAKELWRATAGKIPETSPGLAFGTPEIALDIQRLFSETDLQFRKTLRMAGHEDGMIAFGMDLKEALQLLLNLERIYL